jgi:DnaJ-like protein/PASTA domain-containing protein
MYLPVLSSDQPVRAGAAFWSRRRDPGDVTERGIIQPGITWYDVLGVMPGAEARRIKREYDARAALLRPELTSGAALNVTTAVTRAQHILDTAWEVLGDPQSRKRYDETVGLRCSGGGLGQPETEQSRRCPDVRGLFYQVYLEVATRRGLHVRVVRLTERPMAVDGLVVDQDPRPPAKANRGDTLTVQVWHPPARSRQ